MQQSSTMTVPLQPPPPPLALIGGCAPHDTRWVLGAWPWSSTCLCEGATPRSRAVQAPLPKSVLWEHASCLLSLPHQLPGQSSHTFKDSFQESPEPQCGSPTPQRAGRADPASSSVALTILRMQRAGHKLQQSQYVGPPFPGHCRRLSLSLTPSRLAHSFSSQHVAKSSPCLPTTLTTRDSLQAHNSRQTHNPLQSHNSLQAHRSLSSRIRSDLAGHASEGKSPNWPSPPQPLTSPSAATSSSATMTTTSWSWALALGPAARLRRVPHPSAR